MPPWWSRCWNWCRRGAKVSESKAFDRLKAEFAKMAQAPDMIRAKSNNPAFVAEVEPWLIQFESLGKAGMNSMQMIEATEAGNASGALNYAMEAACLLAEMQRYSKEISKAINKHVTEVNQEKFPVADRRQAVRTGDGPCRAGAAGHGVHPRAFPCERTGRWPCEALCFHQVQGRDREDAG